MLKQAFDQLLESEMDRKDFLKSMGIAAVALTGAAVVLRSLTPAISTKKVTNSATAQKISMGYGSSPYGGNTI